jgi:RNA polymerase sigma-70 factor (ECF subfamily)
MQRVSLRAVRGGDFGALVAVLDPDVVLRADGGTALPALTRVVRGAEAVARGAIMFARPSAAVRPALVNGAAGVVIVDRGTPVSIMAFTVRGGRIVEIDALTDPSRISRIDLPALE